MFGVAKSDLPQSALLRRYADKPGHHTDCFRTTASGTVSIAAFIEAFFGSPVLRLERKILSLFGAPSTDTDVTALASGEGHALAAWSVETRNDTQLLLTVFGGGIRTWLMVEPDGNRTKLLFGSAVVPKNTETGQPKIGRTVSLLKGFHLLYSRVVLAAARWQLNRRRS